nr:type IIL restriction-modification enzyme MmeI [Methylibium sp.]
MATVETAKHRTFQFLDANIAPDHKVTAIALPDATMLGVLSSRVHVQWALAAGSKLEDRPVYVKTKCFEAFPLPNLTDRPDLAAQIAATAEELDAHRKRQQAAHAKLTLTDMYNVLDALRLGRALTVKEKLTHTDGLVSVLAELHDRIDALVLQAYGWSDLAPALVGRPGGTLPWPEKPVAQAEAEEALLLRLVALNAERAAEEARGEVRWLRPEFQDPARRMAPALPALPVPTQDEMALGEVSAGAAQKVGGKPPAPSARRPWPADLPEQVRANADMLTASPNALDESALAEGFTGRGPWKKRLPGILLTLQALGRARREGERWRA